jgi:hypothetical protein
MMSKVEFKPGDYVQAYGQPEETKQALKARFIEAGAVDKGNINVTTYNTLLWWDSRNNELRGINAHYLSQCAARGQFIRELTVEQVLGDNRHPQYDLIELYYREWGEWDAYCRYYDEMPWEYIEEPTWITSMQYELRPRKKMMKIGDYKFPEPEREAPEVGTDYCYPEPYNINTVGTGCWAGDVHDFAALKAGQVHIGESKEEAASEHAKAMIKASGGEVDE